MAVRLPNDVQIQDLLRRPVAHRILSTPWKRTMILSSFDTDNGDAILGRRDFSSAEMYKGGRLQSFRCDAESASSHEADGEDRHCEGFGAQAWKNQVDECCSARSTDAMQDLYSDNSERIPDDQASDGSGSRADTKWLRMKYFMGYLRFHSLRCQCWENWTRCVLRNLRYALYDT